MKDSGDFLIYQTENGVTKIDVRIQDDTVWLTQQQMAELYQSSKSNVSEHIKHIFEDGELNNYNIEINDIDKVEEDLLDLNNNEINLAFEKVEKAVNKNIQRGLLLDLWLKLPKELKNNYDPDDEYKELYFRIYDSDEVIMIKTIEVKNSMESSFMPTQKFDTYLFQLYTEWQNNMVQRLRFKRNIQIT